MRPIRQAAGFICFSLGLALLALILMEGAAQAYLVLRARARSAAGLAEIERRYESEAGGDLRWVRDYLRELNDGREGEWRPYIYWRRKPYHGKYLNIDAAGIRRTWNATSSPAPGQLKVFMFGGSMLWGVGARDDFTIPSIVSKTLATQLQSRVWVVNFAELGYVSTQEVIALLRELQKVNVPDIVVFFDGVNDTFSAFQNGVAGIPQNERDRVAAFDALKRFSLRPMIERLALYQLTAALVTAHGGSAPARFGGDDGRSTDALGRATVEVYLQNVNIVEALAQRFGFRAIFFWQPTVFTKKHLSRQEREWSGRSGRKFWTSGSPGPFFDVVYEAFWQRTRMGRIDNVYDLSGVFDEVRDTIFIDEWHVTETGNAKIAEVIARTLVREAGRKARN